MFIKTNGIKRRKHRWCCIERTKNLGTATGTSYCQAVMYRDAVYADGDKRAFE
jgi:hypothetical protein